MKACCEEPARAHADIWRKFWAALEDFGGAEVLTVTKVKAHATQAMVDGTLVSAIDRWGNQLADEAAKKGAECHPSLADFLEQRAVQREMGHTCVQWLGVGLEAAQKVGALPQALTRSQKDDRPRNVRGQRLEVVKDEVWWAQHRRCAITAVAHPSHALGQVGQYFFCQTCGHHGSQRLVALPATCPKTTTPPRRFLLNRMLRGCHPRTGEVLGDVVGVDSLVDMGARPQMRPTARARGGAAAVWGLWPFDGSGFPAGGGSCALVFVYIGHVGFFGTC